MISTHPQLRLLYQSFIKKMSVLVAWSCLVGACIWSSPLRSQERGTAFLDSGSNTSFPEGVTVLGLASVLIQDGVTWLETGVAKDPNRFRGVDAVELEGHINRELISFVASIDNLQSLTVHDQPQELNLNVVLRPLLEAKRLRVLNLAFVEISPRPCSVLGKLEGLEQLQLDFLLRPEEFHAISLLPKLHTLDLTGVTPTLMQGKGSKQFSSLKNLTVQAYSDLSYFENTDGIRSLHVRQAFTGSHVKELTRFNGLENLTIMIDCPSSITFLTRLQKLRSLTIYLSGKIKDGGVVSEPTGAGDVTKASEYPRRLDLLDEQ